MLGDAVTAKLNPLWGLDKEGEISGAWRDSGVPRLWCASGNLAMSRFSSKHLALRTSMLARTRARILTLLAEIKAIEDGIWDGFDRYSGP